MLVLSRRPGETILAGDDISFKILRIEGNQVKIGIDAPKDLAIHRQEVYLAIKRGEPHESNG